MDFSVLPKYQVDNAANGGYKETNERPLAGITPREVENLV